MFHQTEDAITILLSAIPIGFLHKEAARALATAGDKVDVDSMLKRTLIPLAMMLLTDRFFLHDDHVRPDVADPETRAVTLRQLRDIINEEMDRVNVDLSLFGVDYLARNFTADVIPCKLIALALLYLEESDENDATE